MHQLSTGFPRLLVALVVVLAVRADAATIRVAQDGSSSFFEITSGILAASPGDTISIAPGWYQESVPLTTAGNTEQAFAAVVVDSLTIIGDDRDSVIIGPAEPDFTIQGPWGVALLQGVATFLRLESVTIVNVKRAVEATGSVAARDVSIRDCELGFVFSFASGLDVRDLTTTNVENPIFGGSGASQITVSDSEFRTCGRGNGVSFTNGASGIEFDNCVFVECGFSLNFGSSAVLRASSVEGPLQSIGLFDASTLEINGCVVKTGRTNLNVNSSSHVSGSNNIFMGGTDWTLRFSGPRSTSSLVNNHIFRLEGSPVVVADAYRVEPVQIDLRGNWWGTTNADSLRAWIIDGEDLGNPPFFEELAEVLFEPFAPGPVSGKTESIGSFKARYRN